MWDGMPGSSKRDSGRRCCLVAGEHDGSPTIGDQAGDSLRNAATSAKSVVWHPSGSERMICCP